LRLAYELVLRRAYRHCRPLVRGRLGITAARQNCPRLSDGVDAALTASCGAHQRAVVVEGAEIPPAVPRAVGDPRPEGLRPAAPAGLPGPVVNARRQGREAVHGPAQDPGRPDALPSPLRADTV